jgi:hypothetical protein
MIEVKNREASSRVIEEEYIAACEPFKMKALILLLALIPVLNCHATATLITQETFQGLGTLGSGNPGNLGTWVQGSWQERPVGPRTTSIPAPGCSGDAQSVPTDFYYDLTSTYSAESAAGAVGMWVRFSTFGNGYLGNIGTFMRTTTSNGTPFQYVGVDANGVLSVKDSGSTSTFTQSTITLSLYTWYWFQAEWVNGPENPCHVKFSYKPLGGALTQFAGYDGPNVPGYYIQRVYSTCATAYPQANQASWTGRMGGVSLYSISALGDLNGPDSTLIDPVATPTNWYVNPATGNDGNDGLTPTTAWQTVTKLNTEMANSGVLGAAGYATGDTVTIDTTVANLVLGQNSLNINTPGVNIIQLGGGLAGAGEIQAWTTIPSGNWRGPVSGTTHVYQSTLSTIDSGSVLWENDKWMNHPTGSNLGAVQAALDSTAGSFWTDGTTMYVHPFGDTNPSSDGKCYTRSYLRGSSAAPAVAINAPNVHLNGLRTRKTCISDPATGDPIDSYCYQEDIGQYSSNSSMLIENCYGAYGGKHIFGFTDSSLTRQIVVSNCEAEQATPYTAAGGQTCWVDYSGTAGENGTATTQYYNCTTLMNEGLIGSSAGYYNRDQPGWISHSDGAGTPFAEVDFFNCNLQGTLITSSVGTVRVTGGSCKGGVFSSPTVGYINNVLVTNGELFAGAIVRNSIFSLDLINGGGQDAVSGTIDYQGCTIDLSSTTSNINDFGIFLRTGALNFTWRNNLMIGSTSVNFGLLQNATSTDTLVLDHNAYQNVPTISYNYNDGIVAAGRTLAEWQALGFDANSFNTSNPLLTNYIPQAGSPLFNAGANLADLDPPINADYTGEIFPVRTTIGAYEGDDAGPYPQSIDNFPATQTLPETTGLDILPPTTTAGLTITYAVVSGPAAVSGNTLTLTGAGTVVLQASQAGNGAYAPISATQTLTVTQTFAQWEAQPGYFTTQQLADPTISAAAATPENDGVPNLLKYFYDINPTVPISTTDLAALPILGTTMNGGVTYLTLTFRQYALASGLTVAVQTSPDLLNWTTLTNPTIIQTGTDPVTGDPIMQVQVPWNGPQEFMRLQVTLQ